MTAIQMWYLSAPLPNHQSFFPYPEDETLPVPITVRNCDEFFVYYITRPSSVIGTPKPIDPWKRYYPTPPKKATFCGIKAGKLGFTLFIYRLTRNLSTFYKNLLRNFRIKNTRQLCDQRAYIFYLHDC